MERGQEVPRRPWASLLTSSPVKAPEVTTGTVGGLARTRCEPAVRRRGAERPRGRKEMREKAVSGILEERGAPGDVF